MAKFIGGPYDSMQFPVDRNLVEVRLPNPDEFVGFDTEATSPVEWPHVYRKVHRDTDVFNYREEILELSVDEPIQL